MKTFIVSHEAWYAKSIGLPMPEISIIEAHPGGGCYFEFVIKWEVIRDELAPKIEIFDDAWIAFKKYNNLFKRLALLNNMSPQPKDIIQLLLELGFKDVTERKNPN